MLDLKMAILKGAFQLNIGKVVKVANFFNEIVTCISVFQADFKHK